MNKPPSGLATLGRLPPFTPAITRRSPGFPVCLVVMPVVNWPPATKILVVQHVSSRGDRGCFCLAEPAAGATDRARELVARRDREVRIGCRGSRFRLLPRIALRAWVSGSAFTTAPISSGMPFALTTPGGRPVAQCPRCG